MKRLFFITFFLFPSIFAFSQKPVIDTNNNSPAYFIGKTLRVKASKVAMDLGYDDFYRDINQEIYFNNKNIAYRKSRGKTSIYDSLANRTFRCTDAGDYAQRDSYYYLRLTNANNKSIYYIALKPADVRYVFTVEDEEDLKGHIAVKEQREKVKDRKEHIADSIYFNTPKNIGQYSKINPAITTVVPGKQPIRRTIKLEDIRLDRPNGLIGEDFILMPMDKGSQQWGYSLEKLNKHGQVEFTQVPYQGMVGAIIHLDTIIDDVGYFTDKTGRKYQQSVYSGDKSFSHMTPLSELKNAQKWFINTTLWLKNDEIQTFDPVTEKYGKISNQRLEPVTVVDIVTSYNKDSPLRFILKTAKGATGLLDVATNGGNGYLSPDSPYWFPNLFYTKNPATGMHFSTTMWNFIKKGGVKLGMSEKVFLLSQGEPDHINTSEGSYGRHEQWVYGNRYYYFENGVLTSMQY